MGSKPWTSPRRRIDRDFLSEVTKPRNLRLSMVSADNLPFDVLPLIFQHLPSGSDLVSAALVSKSFSSGSIPLIYKTITVKIQLIKRLGSLRSPFETLLSSPSLQPFAQRIAIHAIPFIRQRPSASFLLQIAQVLPKLPNLASFTFVVQSHLALLPPMLPGLVKSDNMRELMLMAEHVGSEQAKLLMRVGYGGDFEKDSTSVSEGETSAGKGLERIWLKTPSPSITYTLEPWIERNKYTLKAFGVSDAPGFTIGFLRQLLNHVPQLTSLRLTQCPDLDHWKILAMLEHLPQLKSLTFTLLRHSTPPINPPTTTTVKTLRCLFLIPEAQNSTPKVQATFNGLLAPFETAALESITFEATDPMMFPFLSVKAMVKAHGASLHTINVLRILWSAQALESICQECPNLVQLCDAFGPELKRADNWFTNSIIYATNLRILVDARSMKPHHAHDAEDLRMTSREVLLLAGRVQNLKRIINANRCWEVGLLYGASFQPLLSVFHHLDTYRPQWGQILRGDEDQFLEYAEDLHPRLMHDTSTTLVA